MKYWPDIWEKGRKSTKNNAFKDTAPLNSPPFSLKILYKCSGRISASLTPLLTEYTVYSMFIFSYYCAKYTEWPFFSVEFQRLGSADIFGDKTRLHRTIPNQECVPLIQRWKKRWKICSSFLVLILLQFFFVWKKKTYVILWRRF